MKTRQSKKTGTRKDVTFYAVLHTVEQAVGKLIDEPVPNDSHEERTPGSAALSDYVKTKLLIQLGMGDESLNWLPGNQAQLREALLQPRDGTQLQERQVQEILRTVDRTIEDLVPSRGRK